MSYVTNHLSLVGNKSHNGFLITFINIYMMDTWYLTGTNTLNTPRSKNANGLLHSQGDWLTKDNLLKGQRHSINNKNPPFNKIICNDNFILVSFEKLNIINFPI